MRISFRVICRDKNSAPFPTAESSVWQLPNARCMEATQHESAWPLQGSTFFLPTPTTLPSSPTLTCPRQSASPSRHRWPPPPSRLPPVPGAPRLRKYHRAGCYCGGRPTGTRPGPHHPARSCAQAPRPPPPCHSRCLCLGKGEGGRGWGSGDCPGEGWAVWRAQEAYSAPSLRRLYRDHLSAPSCIPHGTLSVTTGGTSDHCLLSRLGGRGWSSVFSGAPSTMSFARLLNSCAG